MAGYVLPAESSKLDWVPTSGFTISAGDAPQTPQKFEDAVAITSISLGNEDEIDIIFKFFVLAFLVFSVSCGRRPHFEPQFTTVRKLFMCDEWRG